MAKYGEGLYGILQYGEELQPTGEDIQPSKPDLMRFLPLYYRKSKLMIELQNTIAEEIGRIVYDTDDVIKQFFVDTATWGLSLWEQMLDLETNLSLSYEERREIIKAKLRGVGTTTKQMIKTTAEAFSGGEVDVIEYPEEYRFVVKFIGVKGIPRNIQGFIDMLETIKPAHLAYEFKYTYTVWNHLTDLVWGQANAMTWDELKVYEGE